MNQLHFFPVRSAKAMCREQRGTVSVRLLNTFNTFKAFPEPNRARRMRIPARFYGVLLAGMLGLVLTSCGGNGSGSIGGGTQNSQVVSNIQTLAGEDYILVGWTNPNRMNITGFVITTRRDNASVGGTTELNSVNVAPRARVIYNITDLTNNITYHITIGVRYESGIIVTSPPVSSTTGTGAGVGTDIDDDREDNNIDNCPLVANADQANTDNADDGGDACDDDDDNDGVADTEDAFRTDACASTDTDEDGNPDRLSAVCRTGVNTTLIEDPDDDNDGVADTGDNCPLVANLNQINTDNADDGGDACDGDDDNDGLEDSMDTCPTGVTGWTSNASTDNDRDGCRDDSNEDLDDDNDGVADTDDAFRTDACASTDTDGDGAPDRLSAGCRTGVNTTLTEDVDDNNNSLIEIHTLDDLARLRDDLNGDGADDGRILEITSVDSMGCPDDDDGGCVGYELTRSFNFSDDASYAAGSGNRAVWTTGSGWQPIGSCSSADNCTSYTGIFDGGGYRIADLFISASNTTYGVGLFGALTGDIQNLHLRNANVSGGATDVDVGGLVGNGRNASIRNASVSGGSVSRSVSEGVPRGSAGGLVGDGENADIRNASVSGVSVAGIFAVGGLVGNGQNTTIRYAVVSGGVVSGARSSAGGLVGQGLNADIRYASVSGGSVTGSNAAGGLVGDGRTADIRNASVSGVSVAGSIAGGLVGLGEDADIRYTSVSGVDVSGGSFYVGGLVGLGPDADIRYASVSGVNVSGSNAVGGLVGLGQDADIRYASVSGVNVSGSNIVGGLVGDGRTADIRYAAVSGGSVKGTGSNVGGLVGQGGGAQINYSYAAPGLVSGSGAVGGLIGRANPVTDVIASYWDNQTTMQSMSASDLGEGHSTTALQSPTEFTGIYVDWGNAWCNPNTGEEMTSSSQPPGFIRVWDLGNSTQYPALNCLPGGLSAQDR